MSIERLEGKIDSLSETVNTMNVNVCQRLTATEVKVEENQKDINGLGQKHVDDVEVLHGRVSGLKSLIVAGFSILGAIILLLRFVFGSGAIK